MKNINEQNSDKSYVTLEQKQCLVCGQLFETGNILFDKRLKNSFAKFKFTLTGNGLCPEHQKLSDENYIALIVVKEDGKTRTGDFVHVKKELAERMFTDFPDTKIAYIDGQVFSLLQDMMQQTEENK